MKYTMIVWHDAKTYPPKKDGRYLVFCEDGYLSNLLYADGWNCSRSSVDGSINREHEMTDVIYWHELLTKDDFKELVL